MCSLSLAMEANSLVNVMNLLNNLEDLNEENQEYSFDSISINCIRTYDDIIRESPEYQTIRFKYEEIYNKFQCKCKATEI